MSDLSNAIKQICEEKGLSYEAVLGTIESALAAAYRKDFGEKNQNIVVEFDPETAKSKVFDVKTVVEDQPEEEESEKEEVRSKKENEKDKESEEEYEEEKKFNPKTDIQLSEAKKIKKSYKVGDVIKTPLEVPGEFGRMAAQTAKQVIIQRLREAERETIFNEFEDKAGEVVSGVVQRREGRVVLVDLGRAVGILPQDEQIYGEKYNPGDRVKVYIKEVKLGSKGPEIILSRTSEKILEKIFYLEIPEISNGLVELKAVAREAGSRAKVAVATESENVDPIGSCVGQRGARIQTIIQELGGEKVDIIEWDEDISKFISNALSPAKIISIDLDEEEKKAIVKVATDQLSLAIGKNGQNARLAARLTGWKIDIIEEGGEGKEKDSKGEDKEDASEEASEKVKEKEESKEKEEKVEEKEDKKKDKEVKVKK